MSMQAIVIDKLGGPEEMKTKQVPIPEPGKGEVLIKNVICGVNFLDQYIRTGAIPLLSKILPATLGVEAAGIIAKLGEGVEGCQEGQRVTYLHPDLHGSFAEYTKLPASRLVHVPDYITFEQAVTSMIQGMSSHYLTHDSYEVKPGDKVLVHAAAGGTGKLLCQAAKNAGAFVIGTTSTSEKAQKAKQAGCDEVIMYREQDFVQEVNRITDNKGVNVIYDGVGKATFEKGFDCLARRGRMVLFGGASGYPETVNLSTSLSQSKSVIKPVLFDYIVKDEELRERSSIVFQWIKEGKMVFGEPTVLPLTDAKKAYELLESGKSTGKLVLKV